MTAPTDAIKPVTLEPAELALRGKVLRWITILAVVDLFLFLPLIYAVATGNHDLSPIFGPAHGTGTILEVLLVAWGSYNRWWGWWYTAVTVITTGPPGVLLGHNKAKREALGE